MFQYLRHSLWMQAHALHVLCLHRREGWLHRDIMSMCTLLPLQHVGVRVRHIWMIPRVTSHQNDLSHAKGAYEGAVNPSCSLSMCKQEVVYFWRRSVWTRSSPPHPHLLSKVATECTWRPFWQSSTWLAWVYRSWKDAGAHCWILQIPNNYMNYGRAVLFPTYYINYPLSSATMVHVCA